MDGKDELWLTDNELTASYQAIYKHGGDSELFSVLEPMWEALVEAMLDLVPLVVDDVP